MTFEWEGWSVAGPWGASGTLKGDALTVHTTRDHAPYRLRGCRLRADTMTLDALQSCSKRELDAFAARLVAAGFSMHDNPFGSIHHFGVAFFEPEADECVRLALSTSDAPAGVYSFDFVQLYQLSDDGVRSLWRGRCTGAERARD